MIPNLGELISKFAQHESDCVLMHCDVDVMRAPSECHGDVADSMDIELVSLETKLGLTFDDVIKLGEKRTSPNAMKRCFDECVSRILFRDNPFT